MRYPNPNIRRTLELTTTIKHTFEPIIQTTLYPRSQIDVFILVLQQDGGLLQACLNATTLALANAGVPLTDYVCAISAGVHATEPLLDLTALEEGDVPHATVAVLPRSGALTLVNMETRLHVERFEALLKVAGEAGKVLHTEMRTHLRAHTTALVDAMSAVPGGGGPTRASGDVQERRYNEDMDEL
jgi:exosome complex component RRP41